MSALIAFAFILSAFPIGSVVARGGPTSLGAASRIDLPHARDHVVVEIAPGANAEDVLGKRAETIMGRWHTHPVPPGKTPFETVQALLSRPGVETAELDYRIQLDPGFDPVLAPVGHVAPIEVNDPGFDLQWHFPAVQVDSAWAGGSGAGVVVAVVDTGISQDGEDLDCHTFVEPFDATGTPGPVIAEDDHGHGTHIAGTIAQCTNNGIGVAGVAFDAALMPIKVLDSSGTGLASWLADGIDWARNHGADVINMSLGWDDPDFSHAMVDDALEAAAAEGLVLVGASGNDRWDSVAYPANHPDVIAVGATEYGNQRAPYSNRGSALDVVAPGGNNSKDENGDGFADGVLQETFVGSTWAYWFFNGTSMATPHVVGAAALLLSAAPGLNPSQVERALECSARDLGASGFDTNYGHGLIQLHDALLSITTTDTTPPVWPSGGDLSFSKVTGTNVNLGWPAAHDIGCIARYRIYQDGKQIATTGSTKTSISVDGLTPATNYMFKVRAEDKAGNLGTALSARLATSDTIPPVWDSTDEILVLTYGETSLKLGWDAAADDVGVVDYLVRVNARTVATFNGRQFTVTGLQPGEGYRVEVLARDTAGNWSDPLTAVVNTALEFEDTFGHTFYGDILWMSGSGVTRGCNPPVNDLFCPDDPVTRGQMAAFLVRALGLIQDNHPGFDDVPSDSTFADDIGKLATAGVTRGCNPPVNDRFCPDDSVTRGQMAAFLARALGLTSNSHPGFGDVASGSTFAEDIGKLATAGVTRGCNPPANDLFCPEDSVTRGQLAAFLRRALG